MPVLTTYDKTVAQKGNRSDILTWSLAHTPDYLLWNDERLLSAFYAWLPPERVRYWDRGKVLREIHPEHAFVRTLIAAMGQESLTVTDISRRLKTAHNRVSAALFHYGDCFEELSPGYYCVRRERV